MYDHKFWWSDEWDPLSYGKEYDFSKSFFQQFKEFRSLVPLPNLWSFNLIDSEYANYSLNSKNIYLSTSIAKSEDVAYSMLTERVRKAIDSFKIEDSEEVYEAIYSSQLNKCCFLVNSRACIDSRFLFDCVNCQNCFMCNNLRNKTFCIKNKQYSKEEYFLKINDFNTGSYKALLNLREEFSLLIKESIHKYANFNKIIDSNGDNITESQNSSSVFACDNIQNVNYAWRVGRLKDSYDTGGCLDSELIYEATVAGVQNYGSKFYTHSTATKNIEYCWFCPSGSDLFGCIGCRSKQYCILNKQYTKEEYEILLPKIIEHMKIMPYIDLKGRSFGYGEFFPFELSPFAYNQTIAQDFFPLTHDEIIDRGYVWKNKEERHYSIDIESKYLPDNINDVDNEILGKTIECFHKGTCDEQCTQAFKIIADELQFYKKMNLSLPRFCSNCRYHQRINKMNPLKLWHRLCMNEGCNNEFETSYAPDRPEKVYCEKCYQQEVL